MKKERIGLFGGTFNPVHLGHLRAAEAVRRRFGMDRVLFIPSFIPPHKGSTQVASPYHRLRMVELAVSAFPHFAPSSIEIEARGRSYSILTLKKIKKIYPGAFVFFILGADAFLEIETWRDYQEVLKQCFFIVIGRPGYSLEKAKDVIGADDFGRLCDLSGREGGVGKDLLLSFRIFLLPIDGLDISSTDVRRRIMNDDPLKGMVPEKVEAYIKENRLYH